MNTRQVIVIGALVVSDALLAPPLSAKDLCTKIIPVVRTIDVYAGPKDDVPAKKLDQSAFPDACSMSTENGRYKIRLQGKFVWVPTAEFSGRSEPLQALPRSPGTTPAAPLAQTPGNSQPRAITGAGPRQVEPFATIGPRF
jgi:hypothetical protein